MEFFPGAGNIDELWQSLVAEKDLIEKFSNDKLDSSVPAELAENPNYVKATGVMPHYDSFDCTFFGITPREAELMDPQQRKFLEICYHALEKAGYHSEKYEGQIGVYAGMAQ
jgi:acyl transferase domain-containing protein